MATETNTSNLPLLHSLTAEWTTFTDDPTSIGIAPTIRKLQAEGLAEFDGCRARRTAKGAKFMNRRRVELAEYAFNHFATGVGEALAGEHVPSWRELADGFVLLNAGGTRSRAGEGFVRGGRVFVGETGCVAGYAPTVADFYASRGLVNANTVAARAAA